MTILSVQNLTVDFGAFRAVDDVGLTVAHGERLALLGHNGAGKSTLFKAVLGFLRPTAGTLSINGAVPASDTARQAINYLPENVAFARNLTGLEVLRYFSGLRGAPRSGVMPLLERVGLAEAARRQVGTYSKGMRQRLGLAQALVGEPRLLLLDEPTSGLDPISRRDFYDIITEATGRGSSVLLSSHGLEEVEHRVDRIAILARGKMRATGTLSELARAAALPVRIRATAPEGGVERLHADLGGTRFNGRSVDVLCSADEKLGLLGRIGAMGGLVSDVDVHVPGLTDVYRHYSDLAEGAQA